MKKIVLFPYHPDVELLTERELKKFSIVGVYSFKEDAAIIRIVNKKFGCSSDFPEMLEQCDIVLLLDNYRKYKTKKYDEVIQAAIAAGKQLVVVPLVEQELNLEEYKSDYTVLQNIPENVLYDKKKKCIMNGIMQTIEAPIIAVFGMGKNCCKFENQVLLKSILDREGYKSVWISSNPLGVLFGSYTMPGFLYDRHLAFEEKVIRFNHFVYQIYVDQKPDVFIIGVPEGISQFTVQEYNHFAEYPLIIGSAVPVDDAILCTYFLPTLDIEGVKNLICHCKEKFGFHTHMVSVGRTAFERMQSDKQITYLFLEEEYLQKYYEVPINQPDFCVEVWETKKIELAIEKVINRLHENPDAL